MINYISSTQNPKIKNLLLLQQKSSHRKEQGLFIVEGRREIMHCVNAGYELNSVFFCPEILGTNVSNNESEVVKKILSRKGTCKLFEVNKDVYNKIAYRQSTEGIIAEVKVPNKTLTDLKLKENPLIIVLESVEKPGNLGAVLRSADACGADAVILCDPLTDLYNPNLIRSSIGAIFTVPCVTSSSQECIDYLKEKDIQILTAQLQDSEVYYDCDMKKGTAIIMGTESTGLKNIWREAADKHIRIPMLGSLDSLNVSVSAAILLFEALRQRQNTKA